MRSLGVPLANAGVPLKGDVPPWRPPGLVRSLKLRERPSWRPLSVPLAGNGVPLSISGVPLAADGVSLTIDGFPSTANA